MFKGKNKAVTFSFDDGIMQDCRLIEIFDKYDLKATFNINSGLVGFSGNLERQGKTVPFNRVQAADIANIYKNHEVAVHTLTHPNLTELEDDEIIYQVENDRKKLSSLCGYEVVGMAYPCGGVNNNDRVAEIIRNNTGVKYARTITSSNSFDLQKNLYRFNPTILHLEMDKMFSMAEEFIQSEFNEPKIYYIWGHSFEFDIENTWDRFEDFCKLISNREDIFYGTNSEVLLTTH